MNKEAIITTGRELIKYSIEAKEASDKKIKEEQQAKEKAEKEKKQNIYTLKTMIWGIILLGGFLLMWKLLTPLINMGNW
jgi:hypothetical protein